MDKKKGIILLKTKQNKKQKQPDQFDQFIIRSNKTRNSSRNSY